MLPDESAAYCPEELSLFGEVLDSAVESLPPSLRTAGNRTAIARNILACAATGVRDACELRIAATMNLTIIVASPSHAGPSPSRLRRPHNSPGTAARLPPFRQTRMTSWANE